jgi:hypothetical protein
VTSSPVPLDDQLRKVADRLVQDYAGAVPDGVVRQLVDDESRPYRDAPVTQFVPVLVDRSVRRQLSDRPG